MQVISLQDTLKEALLVMSQTKLTTVHIIDATNGQAMGYITLKDICQYLILVEAKEKIKSTTQNNNINTSSNSMNSKQQQSTNK